MEEVLIIINQTNKLCNEAMVDNHWTSLTESDQCYQKPIGFYAQKIDYGDNFFIRQLMKRYKEQNKDMHMVFIDQEDYDKVTRNVMYWAL
jgi:hypothetical protein